MESAVKDANMDVHAPPVEDNIASLAHSAKLLDATKLAFLPKKFADGCPCDEASVACTGNVQLQASIRLILACSVERILESLRSGENQRRLLGCPPSKPSNLGYTLHAKCGAETTDWIDFRTHSLATEFSLRQLLLSRPSPSSSLSSSPPPPPSL
ncbi:hypothetical protein FIBSPDRAFT_989494 [Athelia psychrophila]|uniref:Uncharacterized protein n=1 Tax=Athelia psychrophila TaxID=1759441 RepID=A0A165ZKV8_9AGAM|nr:hypothetical protein FIBSPDRAFT_989494 [Fibularhizoctonia sp. CBS 109695]